MEITIGGFEIPMRTLASLIEVTTPNEQSNRSLDGTLYTDFVNNLRSWKLSFAYLCAADYDDLREVYMNQYRNEQYPTLVVESLGINALVKISVSDKNIRMDGDRVDGYEIALEEQYPIS